MAEFISDVQLAAQVNVLIACEESQAEVAAFRRYGFNAYSCDIQPCIKTGRPDWHICADVRPFLEGKVEFVTQDGKVRSVAKWDLIVAHPPCTYLCKVGSVWMKKGNLRWMITTRGWEWVNPDRYEKMMKAREFFLLCLDAKAKYVAVENPLPMEIANLPRPTTYACPSWYGYKYTKKTLYWLKGLPPLMPENINTVTKCMARCTRGKNRSRTAPPLANAIARQWGAHILQDLFTLKA